MWVSSVLIGPTARWQLWSTDLEHESVQVPVIPICLLNTKLLKHAAGLLLSCCCTLSWGIAEQCLECGVHLCLLCTEPTHWYIHGLSLSSPIVEPIAASPTLSPSLSSPPCCMPRCFPALSPLLSAYLVDLSPCYQLLSHHCLPPVDPLLTPG